MPSPFAAATDMLSHAVFALLLLVFTGGTQSDKVCSYHDIVEYLNLTADSSLYKTTRPVLDHTHITVAELDVILMAILSVVEKTQTFVPFIWAMLKWKDERISWDPDQFCGITKFSIPRDLIWKPDLYIYEMIHKDESSVNPLLFVSYNGMISSEEDMKVVSTCKLDVHKFPFDTQSCNLSIGSALHCVSEFHLIPSSNSSRATQYSHEVLKSQGEWEFLHLSIDTNIFRYEDKMWEQLIYTFTMKRRPLLHVINFLLPILFFLTLDLSSFFISDHRSEKLGFKVTILLAISVLLLILNEILPAMSNETPLIATYSIVIFGLMLLSLLETILVTYLLDKDQVLQRELWLKKQEELSSDQQEAEKAKKTFCWCICKAYESEKQGDVPLQAEEVKTITQSAEPQVLLLIHQQLKELQEGINMHTGYRARGGKFVRWAERINQVYFVLYSTTVVVFLLHIFTEWSS
ncbi:5-hydroxytryptamine receptor 3A-like isoform X2 [Nelusetta ayraudi]|uniref:5-hydroxytryptamine receptor 3A-like isoform X2 n=1 Tax=Nelusetta ayraudi TaxID=303726 RepID=UPI003F723C8A